MRGPIGDKLVELLFLLRSGKNVYVIGSKNLTYTEHYVYNPDGIGRPGELCTHEVEVQYLYANASMTQIYAHLVDGREVPYTLDILEFRSKFFKEYLEPKPVQYTLEELESKLGHKIQIVGGV